LNLFLKIAIPILCLPLAAPAQTSKAPSGQSKEYELGNKRLRGELLTPEEEKLLKDLVTKRTEPYAREHPARESVGLIPLTDLAEEKYKGEQGGLYPNGENLPPPAHLKAGLLAARKIGPRDEDGRESKDGKIVLLSVGMSNASAEFQVFVRHAAKEQGLNPRLKVVDGALGGPTSLLFRLLGTPCRSVLVNRKSSAWWPGDTPTRLLQTS